MSESVKRQLLPEQAAAAYEIKKHVSVTAGPGSGKTTVLVERYIHILREHSLSIDQIVAITFTNRAANEMRERLRSELNLMLRISTDEERRRWLNYKRTLDGAVITTIHGFCARMLREFPIEARVDPQFLLLDEHRAAMMLELIVEEVLSEFISNGHVEISRLTLGVGRSRLALLGSRLTTGACGGTWASTGGWSSAGRGGPRWGWPTPRPTASTSRRSSSSASSRPPVAGGSRCW